MNSKYIHILWANEVKFLANLLKVINREENGLRGKETLFVTPHQMVYDALSEEHKNIILDTSCVHLINKYAPKCEWLFSHGMTDKKCTLLIKRKFFKKIIWRTWGGSRQPMPMKGSLPKRMKAWLINKTYYLFMRHTFGRSPVIGMGKIPDRLDIEQWHWADNCKLITLGYPNENADMLIRKIDNRLTNNLSEHRTIINVMVGHQGNKGEHHVDLVRKLLKYSNKDMRIFLPLSYGNETYINEVVAKLKSLGDDRVIPMTDFLPYDKYLDFLASIDIALIDELSSMALGNLVILIHFRKKIFLHKDGILKKAFEIDGIPYCLSCDLERMSFEEFAAPIHYPDLSNSDMDCKTYAVGIQRWKDLYSYLDSLEKR